MDESLKEKILKLRNEGKNYNEISKELNCSKSTISYHCNNNDLGGEDVKTPLNVIEEIIKYYNEGNSSIKTAKEFNVSKSTVLKYVDSRKIVKQPDSVRRTKSKKFVIWHRKKLKLKAIEYKGGCCEKCGYNKSVYALEFHHTNPSEKDFSPSGKSISWEKMKNEVDKCILVCANCHREIHEELNKGL